MSADREVSVRRDASHGLLEQVGVDYLPEGERTSTPQSAGLVLGGSYFSLIAVVYGWISLATGLTFWQTLSAYLVGGLIGAAITYYLPLIGPLTGTNMTVASGAHFGIRGRFLGSALVLAFATCFGAVTVWACGDALVATISRLSGVEINELELAIIYGVVALAMAAVAVYGFRVIVGAMRIMVPIFALLMLVGVFVFAGDFNPNASTGLYVMGGFWPTWMLSSVFGMAGAIGSATSFADYTRRISSKYSHRSICLTVTAAVLVGNIVPSLFGAFVAASIPQLGDSFVSDLVANSPLWFLPAIVVMAVTGGVSQGVICIYASGLDLEGLFPRLRRYQATIFAAAVSIALVYLGVFVFNIVDAISSSTIMLTTISTPWAVIILLGMLDNMRPGRGYDVVALHDFKNGKRGGTYWYTGGWNLSALSAYAIGTVFGLLGVSTPLYEGPLATYFGGIDISVPGAAAVTAIAYLGISRIHNPNRSRLPSADGAISLPTAVE
ncbi:hypothetical protein AZG88_08060 [Rhodococcus sp. LB1]|nr:hypothetical protein AZG88_08060 [Rhodococcus sp. LB1]